MICLRLSITQLFLIYFVGMYIPVSLTLVVPGWVLILPFFSCAEFGYMQFQLYRNLRFSTTLFFFETKKCRFPIERSFVQLFSLLSV